VCCIKRSALVLQLLPGRPKSFLTEPPVGLRVHSTHLSKGLTRLNLLLSSEIIAYNLQNRPMRSQSWQRETHLRHRTVAVPRCANCLFATGDSITMKRPQPSWLPPAFEVHNPPNLVKKTRLHHGMIWRGQQMITCPHRNSVGPSPAPFSASMIPNKCKEPDDTPQPGRQSPRSQR
jgi:hypothetical protein